MNTSFCSLRRVCTTGLRGSLLSLVLTALFVLGVPQGARAQTDAALSQYFEAPAFYNPAATGVTDLLRIRAGGRLQWAGVRHAPQTFMGMADMPFKLLGRRWGVGAVISQESIGLYKNLSVSAQLSFKQKLFGGMLSAGFQIGFLDKSFRGSGVLLPDDDDYHQSTDEAIPTADIRGNSLDMGLGVWYTWRFLWGGFSAQHLNAPTVTLQSDTGEGSAGGTASDNAATYEYRLGRALYFLAGGNIGVKNTLFEVLPSTLVSLADGFLRWELTGRVRYNKFLTAGLGYRWKDGLQAMISAETKGFYIGFSYDYSTSAIARASSGTYELFVGYSLKLDLGDKNRHRQKSVRIM